MWCMVKARLLFVFVALVLLLTAQPVTAFTVQIDARILSSSGFLIAGKTDLLDGTTVQKLDLTPGTYSFQPGPGSVMACSFRVTAEGRIDFEAACNSFLSGRGTDTLVVRGHTIKLDARALSSTGFLLPNGFGLADHMMSSTEVRSLTLVPLNAYVFQVGAGAVGNFSWGIDQAGRITYDPAFDAFLSGRGTDTLVVRGHTIKLDARALGNAGFILPNVFGLGDQMMSSTEMQTLTLVPVRGSYVFRSGVDNARFELNLDHVGFISYAPGFSGSLFGLGTDTLRVNRLICSASHVVTGFILDEWNRRGGSDSVLGCPVNDEREVAGGMGRIVEFERGQIAWSPKTADRSDRFLQVGYWLGNFAFFEWGQTSPFSYWYFKVQWGEEVKEDNRNINKGYCLSVYDMYSNYCQRLFAGTSDKSTGGAFFVPLPSEKGTLRFVAEGCNAPFYPYACDQGSSNPIVLHYERRGVPATPWIDYTAWGNDMPIPLPSAPRMPIDVEGKRIFRDPTAEEAARSFDERAQRFLAYWACTTNLTDFNKDGEDFTTAILAQLAYKGSCRGQDGEYLDEWENRKRIANARLKTVAKNGQNVGSTVEPGNGLVDTEHGRWGDLDMALKDLIVIPFLYWDLIEPEARKHVMDTLGELTGGVGPCLDCYRYDQFDTHLLKDWAIELYALVGPLGAAALASIEITVDETENHVHMIESTRYLVNQLLRRDQPGVEVYDNRANGLHDWWMVRLQSILKHDFQEYNSKPYNRLSLNAIQNLAEFAAEDDLRTAARMVLDFSSAKFAVSSSLLRREAPFRRRAEHDTEGFLDNGGLDEQMCRFILYTGKLDILPPIESLAYFLKSARDYRLAPRNCNGVVRQAIGSYRVPPLILDLAMNKSHHTSIQMFSGGFNDFHNAPGGVEIYDNERYYLIAAGGIGVPSGLQLHTWSPAWVPVPNKGWNSTNEASDYGYSVPTVLMLHDLSLVQADRKQMIRFDGFEGHKHTANHLCVGRGVACGEIPMVPPLNELVPGKSGFLEALCLPDLSNRPCVRSDFERGDEDQWTVWYIQLAGVTSDLYVAMWKKTFSNWLGPIGFFEVVDPGDYFGNQPIFSFDAFKQAVKRLNPTGPVETHLDNENCYDGTDTGVPSCPPPGKVDVQYVRGSGAGPVTFHFGSPPRQYPIEDNDHASWKMLKTGGRPIVETDEWPFADGPVSAPHHDGLIKIQNMVYPGECILDFRDVHNPQRIGCENSTSRQSGTEVNPEFFHLGEGLGRTDLDKCNECLPGLGGVDHGPKRFQ